MNRAFRFAGAILLISGALLSTAAGEASQELRGFNAIPTPASVEQKMSEVLGQGYQPVSAIRNLSPSLVEKVVYDLFDSWNTPDLGSNLTKDFPNRSRLLDAIQTGAPRYVRLRILAIQNPRIVQQYVRPHPAGDGSYQLLSKVSVRVYSEVAANIGVIKRFQRLEGTSEYLIQVTQKVRVP